ncbi:2,3-bisphosphoglycerate-dependent phosphoglycerate mutase [Lactobacillus sp. ESL0233]|uniref:2,3-bisphosphoglycerate-dependent phosphoglycerate mutase n=1 Tax=unclassified Lactobacillus TaxID=2620435 RepID=UPI000EFC3801|nr:MULTISPECIES: 2,3-bisphosphoglycerate-dependent phosphoglycerate mutase [unclassified Lactobacillus]RMC40953.1 2,3-bisphosphoglycerate-dependent phosphoglycerate mutase [Lactobacillus sp. ESL0233]RMC45251.1 2,3-bisphosphoglycerate-dependent phosphoglycerate mutase [Lactobacillus sp. ESL0230]
MVKLVLLRHGESIANFTNTYTGWNDVALTTKGREQAKAAGQLLKEIADFNPTHIHTSILVRAIETANIVAEAANILYLPLTKTWRLNERHYGILRGVNKDLSRQIYGDKQVLKWRRGFYSIPPAGKTLYDRRYINCDIRRLPQAESLYQTQQRLLPYYQTAIVSKMLKGEDQLVVAHGSSLRALIKKIEQIDDNEIVKLEVANAEPIIYTFDDYLHICDKKILN